MHLAPFYRIVYFLLPITTALLIILDPSGKERQIDPSTRTPPMLKDHSA